MTTSVPAPAPLSRDLLTGSEWSATRLRDLFKLTTDVKAHPEKYRTALAGRFIALIMEKASLRTRVTFEVGMGSLGGHTVYLDQTLSPLGQRESIPDVARNLSRWVQGIVARVDEQRKLELLAQHASIPGDQRAQRPVSSLPGAGGFFHAGGAFRQRARAEAGLRGRRQ